LVCRHRQRVASGNAHLSDDWKEVGVNKRKKLSKDSKSSDKSASAVGTAKKTKVDTGLFVCLKGQDFDLAKEVTRQPVQSGRKLTTIAGAVREVRILKDSIRISCSMPRQKGILMQVVDWFGKPVTVSEPWSQAPAGNRSLVGNHRSTAQRGIIFGVSTQVSESDVKSAKMG